MSQRINFISNSSKILPRWLAFSLPFFTYWLATYWCYRLLIFLFLSCCKLERIFRSFYRPSKYFPINNFFITVVVGALWKFILSASTLICYDFFPSFRLSAFLIQLFDWFLCIIWVAPNNAFQTGASIHCCEFYYYFFDVSWYFESKLLINLNFFAYFCLD